MQIPGRKPDIESNHIDETPAFVAKTGFMATIKQIYKTKPLTSIILLVLILFCLLGLIVGTFIVGTSQALRRVLILNYNNAVTSFDPETIKILNNTKFSLQLEFNETSAAVFEPFDIIHDTNYVPPQLSILKVRPYDKTYFEFSDNLLKPATIPRAPYKYNPASPVIWGPLHNLTVLSNYDGVDKIESSPSFSLWKIEFTSISGSNQIYDAMACVDNGDYYDMFRAYCARVSVLIGTCFQVTFNAESKSWSFEKDEIGCYYPFTTPANYGHVNYNQSSTVWFPMTNVTLLSHDIPEILLEEQTHGAGSFETVIVNRENIALGIIVGAILLAVLTFIIAIILFFTQKKAWARGSSPKIIDPFSWKQISWLYLLIHVFCFGFALGLGIPMVGHQSQEPVYDPIGFFGVIVMLVFLPLGVLWLLQFMGSISKHVQLRVRVLMFVLILIESIGLTLFCWLYMIKPNQLEGGINPQDMDSFSRFIGIGLSFIMISIASICIVLLIRIIRGEITVFSLSKDKMQPPSPYRSPPPRSYPILLTCIGFLIVIPVCFIASTMLPPIWDYPLAYYIFTPSPYSLVDLHINLTQPGEDANVFSWKLFTDVTSYYAYIYVLVLLAFISAIPPIGRIMRKRIPFPKNAFFQTIIKQNLTVGETILLVGTTGFVVWWFLFWKMVYKRTAHSADGKLDSWARSVGNLSSLFFSWLFFPVSRNSIWEVLFGISYERLLWYHRYCGLFFYLTVTAHFGLWMGFWGERNHLPDNLWAIQNLDHPDNFTPPIMVLTWIGMTIMVVLSYERFRRNNFELFYYFHHFSLVIVGTALVHSWSLWFFLAGPLILWWVDRCIRFINGTEQMQVIDFRSIHKEQLKMELRPLNKEFNFRAGQYCFINVPAVSSLEWHPFSISSHPYQSTISFHIKNMGKGTWTSKLVRLSRIASREMRSQYNNLIVNVDGPYGNPPSLKNYPVLVMLGGGIGITPIHSILSDIEQTALLNMDPDLIPNPKRVYMFWTVRDVKMFSLFSETFKTIKEGNLSSDMMDLRFFVTRSVRGEFMSSEANTKPSDSEFDYETGRPALRQEFSKIRSAHPKQQVLVFVCGPKPMVEEAGWISREFGFDFHEETFEF